MRYRHHPKRRRILEQARQAVTLPEIEAALQQLQEWKEAHPEDLAIEDAFEPLALMRLALQESALPSSEPLLTGPS